MMKDNNKPTQLQQSCYRDDLLIKLEPLMRERVQAVIEFECPVPQRYCKPYNSLTAIQREFFDKAVMAEATRRLKAGHRSVRVLSVKRAEDN